MMSKDVNLFAGFVGIWLGEKCLLISCYLYIYTPLPGAKPIRRATTSNGIPPKKSTTKKHHVFSSLTLLQTNSFPQKNDGLKMRCPIPDAQCMAYLPTFTIILGQM